MLTLRWKRKIQTRLKRADLSSLTPKEQELLHLRYLGDRILTLQEVARKLGVSRQRAQQLESVSLKKLGYDKEENLVKRQMISFPTPVQEHIKQRQDRLFGQQATDDLSLFYGLLDALTVEMKGKFDEFEVRYLIDCFNGIHLEPQILLSWPGVMAGCIHDAAILERLDVKWGIDIEALAEKVSNLLFPQALWLYDRIQLYWKDPQEERIEELF